MSMMSAVSSLGVQDLTVDMYAMTYRFQVKVGDDFLGTWNKLDGLQMDFQYAQYVAGMNPDERSHISAPIWNYPTRVKFKELTLARPVTTAGIKMTANWLYKIMKRPSPSMGHVWMFDAGGIIPVWGWGLINVQPSAWSGPSLDVESGKLAVETLTLVHGGLQLDPRW